MRSFGASTTTSAIPSRSAPGADSALGIPGLVHVIRAGNVVVANALGSALLETSAFAGFYPAINERLFGEKLKMPTIATWWCGEAPALEYVLSHLDELV